MGGLWHCFTHIMSFYGVSFSYGIAEPWLCQEHLGKPLGKKAPKRLTRWAGSNGQNRFFVVDEYVNE